MPGDGRVGATETPDTEGAGDVMVAAGVKVFHVNVGEIPDEADRPAILRQLAETCPFLIAGGGIKDAEGARRYLEAGADAAFVEAPETMDEMEAVPGLVGGPCLLNIVRGGKSPDVDLDAAERMGYKIAILPSLLLVGAIGACEGMLDELKTSRVHPVPPNDMSVRERFRIFGADEWDALRNRYRERPQETAPGKVPAAGK